MTPEVLFQVPRHLTAAVEAGLVERVGALLVESDTRRIVAHMEETGALRSLASSWSGSLGSVGNPLGFGTSAIGLIQNEQIKLLLRQLQVLQIGDLLLSGVGFGATLITLSVMNAKLDRLASAVERLEEQIDKLRKEVADIQATLLRNDLADLRSGCERVEEAWARSDCDAEWRAAAAQLQRLQNRFCARSIDVKASGMGSSSPVFDLMIESWLTAGAARITACVAAGEVRHAEEVAQKLAADLAAVTRDVGVLELAGFSLKTCNASRLASAMDFLEARRLDAEARCRGLREREELAATRAVALDFLQKSGRSGRDHLLSCRSEGTSPLAIVMHGASEAVPAG